MIAIRTLLLCCALVACGDDDGGSLRVDAQVDAPMAVQMIGPAGGTVTVPGGPTVTIPAGALSTTVTITITGTTEQGPGAVTTVYKFEPEGLTFAIPASVSFPVSNATSSLRVYWSMAAGVAGYDELASTYTASTVAASITHFSNGYVAPATPTTAQGDHHAFVLDSISIPTSNLLAQQYGLDLDGDQAKDNQLGMLFATYESMNLSISPVTTEAVDRGHALVLADLQTASFTSAQGAGLRTYVGATPSPAPCLSGGDTTCRQHLAGTGTFTVASTSPNNGWLVGNIVSGTLTGGPGNAVIQLAMSKADRVLTLNLIGARAKVSAASATGITSGVLAGALTATEIDKLHADYVLAANENIAADCNMLSSPPGCGCTSNSAAASQISLYDVNHDCAITLAEYKGSSLTVSLYATDVIIDGQAALSLGLGFTAVPATFTP